MNEYLKSLYIDYSQEQAKLFDINCNSVIEMRGEYSKILYITNNAMIALLNDCMVDVVSEEQECLLQLLWIQHERESKNKRKHTKLNFYDYIRDIFEDSDKHSAYLDVINDIENEKIKDEHIKDYQFLVEWFSEYLIHGINRLRRMQ